MKSPLVPRPTLIGVAPPKAGSAPEPTRSLTPTGRYRLKLESVETVKFTPDLRPFAGDVNRSGLTWQAWFAATGRDSYAVKAGWSPVLTEHESLFDAWRRGEPPSTATEVSS